MKDKSMIEWGDIAFPLIVATALFLMCSGLYTMMSATRVEESCQTQLWAIRGQEYRCLSRGKFTCSKEMYKDYKTRYSRYIQQCASFRTIEFNDIT